MFMWNPVPSLHTESVLTKEDLQLQTRQGSEEEELEVGHRHRTLRGIQVTSLSYFKMTVGTVPEHSNVLLKGEPLGRPGRRTV